MKKIKLYKLDRNHVKYYKGSPRLTPVFDIVGQSYINPAQVKLIIERETIAPERGYLDTPPILCKTTIIMIDGTAYCTDEPADLVKNNIFGGK